MRAVRNRDLRAISNNAATDSPLITSGLGPLQAQGTPHQQTMSVAINTPSRSPTPSTALRHSTLEDPLIEPYSSEVTQNNVNLKSDVVEYEELLETTHEVQLQGAESNREMLRSRTASSIASIERFDEKFHFPTSSHFNRDKLVDVLALQLDNASLLKQLQTLDRTGRLGGAVAGRAASPSNLEIDLAASVVSSTSAYAAQTAFPSSASALLPRIEDVLSLLHQKLTQEQLGGAKEELTRACTTVFGPSCDTFGPALVQLSITANTDVLRFIRSTIETSEPLLQKKLAAVEACEHDYEQAKQSPEDVLALEEAMKARVNALHEALLVSRERLNQVMMSSGDDGNLRSTYENASKLVRKKIEDERQIKHDFSEKVLHDIDRVGKEIQSRKTKDADDTSSFHKSRDESIQKVQMYASQQDALWVKVEELIAEMGRIGKDRAEEVRRHLQKTEEEYQRRRFHAEFVAIAQRQVDQLNMLLQFSQLSSRILDAFEGYQEHMSTQVEAKSFDDGLGEMRRTEQSVFLELYKPFATAVNELWGHTDSRCIISSNAAMLGEIFAKLPFSADKGRFQHHKKFHEEMTRSAQELAQSLESKASHWKSVYDSLLQARTAAAQNAPPSDVESKAEDLWTAAIRTTKHAIREAWADDDAEIHKEEATKQELEEGIKQRVDQLRKKRQDKSPSPRRDRRSIGKRPSPSRHGRPMSASINTPQTKTL